MALSDSPTQATSAPGLESHHILQHDSSSTRRHLSDSSNASSEHPVMREKRQGDFPQVNRQKAYSLSSQNTRTSMSTRAENRATQRDVRTLPPWIDSFEEDDDAPANAKPTDRLLSSPSRAHAAQHHFAPTKVDQRISQDGYVDIYDEASHGVLEKKPDTGFFSAHREPEKGRKWDHARQGDPVIMQSGVLPNSTPWRSYIQSSMYGPALDKNGKRVDEGFLQEQTPGYEMPWRGDIENENDPEKASALLHNKKHRKTFYKRLQHILLMHPLVPLAFRLIVLTTSTIALSLSGSVYHLSNKYRYPQNPSTTMAIVVDVVAIPYILYVTWDEYTGKPLGLRSPKAKIRLVLLDLFFIIFESANLSLSFGALTDDNGCCKSGNDGFNYIICDRVKALCGILMVALIAWGLTFSVSIFRLVERVGGRDEGD